MILDHAADLISADGVSGVSLERIGISAGISKSLMYKYFEGPTELLRELLVREMDALRKLQFEAAESATTFEELVRNITHVYLSHIEKRGLILERLQREPSISEGHDPTQYGRDSAVAYIANIVAEQFSLPADVARAATDISFGLPAAAGEYLLKGNMPLEEIEDITVTMILGSINQMHSEFLTRKQIIK